MKQSLLHHSLGVFYNCYKLTTGACRKAAATNTINDGILISIIISIIIIVASSSQLHHHLHHSSINIIIINISSSSFPLYCCINFHGGVQLACNILLNELNFFLQQSNCNTVDIYGTVQLAMQLMCNILLNELNFFFATE